MKSYSNNNFKTTVCRQILGTLQYKYFFLLLIIKKAPGVSLPQSYRPNVVIIIIKLERIWRFRNEKYEYK